MRRFLPFALAFLSLGACTHKPIDQCQSLGVTPGTEGYFECNDTLHGAGATEHQPLYTIEK